MNLPIATVCACGIALAAMFTASQFRGHPQAIEAAASEPAAKTAPGSNPTAHIYREGDRVSAAHGEVKDVLDWNSRNLPTPPADHRWVQYGETYLLVDGTTGLIKTIMPASWGAGRA